MKLGPRSQVSTGEETSHMEFTRIWIPQLIEHPQVVGLIVTNNVDTNTECYSNLQCIYTSEVQFSYCYQLQREIKAIQMWSSV